jgi:hypothetical protein
MQQRYGSFEQLVQKTLRQAQDASNGTFRYHSSPLKGDRRYYFLNGDNGVLEVACIPATDDAEWTFLHPNWLDQNPRWNQFQANERNEAFLQLKIRELRVRLGMPWEESEA